MSEFVEEGKWRTKYPSMFSAARSLLGQALAGVELSRIAMPADYFFPFSALEIGAARTIGRPGYLVEMVEAADDEAQMRAMVRWLLCGMPLQNLSKKPFNPIVGEVHDAYAEIDGHVAAYVAEQVSHHPPVFAYALTLDDPATLRDEGHGQFEVRFEGSNSVRLSVCGTHRITVGDRVTYEFSRPAPDVLVSNVIFGTRSARWDGAISIRSTSGWVAELSFATHHKRSAENTVLGTLRHAESSVERRIAGAIGGKVYADADVLFDWATVVAPRVLYPAPEHLDSLDSLVVWGPVAKHIVADSIRVADSEKRLVEDAQRQRRRDRTDYAPRLFVPEHEEGYTPPPCDADPEADSVIPPRYRFLAWERLTTARRPHEYRTRAVYRDPVLEKQLSGPG